jgi:isoquinoline 1-oxidoreductase beta subunit
MTTTTNTSRRHFVIGSSAIATGLAIGFDLSLMSAANAAMGTGTTAMTPLATPEIGVWVVVKPNDDVVVRIVRSEMGQSLVWRKWLLKNCSATGKKFLMTIHLLARI